jgi:D-glycero-alpha-D-manno-heptose-7-phosphate kinase
MNLVRDIASQVKVYRAKAPLRISFCGGGTDMPDFFDENGGVVLSTTIDKYSHVTLIPRDDKKVKIKSLDFDLNIEFNVDKAPIYDGVLDLAKAVIHELGLDHGFDLHVHSDVPPGSGLGTSSTFTVAILGVLLKFLNDSWDKYDISETAYKIERIKMAIKGGKQDQYAAAFGGFNLIEFYKEKTVVNGLSIHKGILNDLACHLMMCYTGKTHYSTELTEKQLKYYREGRKETVDALPTLKRMTYEMKDSLMTGNLKRFGELLHESGLVKKQANPHVTDNYIDSLYQVALENGAIGGKILGAGAGGFILLFCEVTKKHIITKELEKLGGQMLTFGFDRKGLQTWSSNCL